MDREESAGAADEAFLTKPVEGDRWNTNSVLFWKFISNLPRSITQRRRSFGSPNETLSPEVTSYLVRCQQQQQAQLQTTTNSSPLANKTDGCNITRPLAADLESRAARGSSGLLLEHQPQQQQASCLQILQEGHRLINIVSPQDNQAARARLIDDESKLAMPNSHGLTDHQQQPRAANQEQQHKLISSSSSTSTGNNINSKTTRNYKQHASIISEGSELQQLQPTTTTTTSNEHQVPMSTKPTTSATTCKDPHIKLSLATSTATTTSRSSASSLSSCVLSGTGGSIGSEVRLKWGKKMDFLLSIIGFAVDLANIWRFPYLVYKNGGGVFLIPYVIMLIFGGIPLFFLELCLGQFVKKGPITVWNKICPAMKGVGYCSILISWYVSFYYNVLIGWSVYFIYRSFTSFGDKLPWEDCDNPWNSGRARAYSHTPPGNTTQFNSTSAMSGSEPSLSSTLSSLILNSLSPSDENFSRSIESFLAGDESGYQPTLQHDIHNNTMNSMQLHDQQQSDRATCVSIATLKDLCSNHPAGLDGCKRSLFRDVNITSPATEFFVRELSQIDQSTGLDDMGQLRWELVFCIIVVYLLHYCSLFRGLETSGKVVWVTATAPYIILSVLLVRGLFLPGAVRGMQYYLSPRLEKLADPGVWTDAAVQVFYSIGVGFGVHLTYASFNSHNNDCHRDCLMTSAVNVVTSVYSGLVVFVYIGYMAQNMGVEIDQVASEGYSLVFEVYPDALTTLPFARFWSILFFIMLLTLGLDSAMGGLEAVITGIEDEFRFAKNMHRGVLTGLVIFSSFLFALISCTQGGAYTLFWFDIYSASVSLLFSALFEALGVVYFYGLDKFILDIESMLGRRPHMFYIICWKYISPLFLGGVILTSICTASIPVYRNYKFPVWSVVLGWILTFSSVSAVPIVAALHYFRGPDSKAIRARSGTSSRHAGLGTAGSRSGKKTPAAVVEAPSDFKSSSNWINCQASKMSHRHQPTTTAV